MAAISDEVNGAIGAILINLTHHPSNASFPEWIFAMRYALPAAAFALVMISGYWFTERAFAVDLPAGAIMNRALAWLG
jgi:hypothetical protein